MAETDQKETTTKHVPVLQNDTVYIYMYFFLFNVSTLIVYYGRLHDLVVRHMISAFISRPLADLTISSKDMP